MTWLPVSVLYASLFRNYNLAISSFMTDDQILVERNMTGTTSVAITIWEHLRSPEVTPGFCVVRVAQLIFVCVVFYISFFAFFSFFLLAIVLSVLRFTASDYSFTDDPIHHFLWHPTHPFILDT